jgi:hypothetical protein
MGMAAAALDATRRINLTIHVVAAATMEKGEKVEKSI